MGGRDGGGCRENDGRGGGGRLVLNVNTGD